MTTMKKNKTNNKNTQQPTRTTDIVTERETPQLENNKSNRENMCITSVHELVAVVYVADVVVVKC